MSKGNGLTDDYDNISEKDSKESSRVVADMVSVDAMA